MVIFPRLQSAILAFLAGVACCVLVVYLVIAFGVDVVAALLPLVACLGFVLLLAFVLAPLGRIVCRLPSITSIVLGGVLFGGLNTLFFLLDEAINQPHPRDGLTWLSGGLAKAFRDLPLFAGAMVVVLGLDALWKRPRDGGYCPELASLWRGMSQRRVRLVLLNGGLLVFSYYAVDAIMVLGAYQRPHGLVWPPRYVYDSCLLLWGLLWLADCVGRPQRGTMAAAIGYLCVILTFELGAHGALVVE